MGSMTPNLGLYKANPTTDGNDTFNIDTMLNENWDKIDDKLKEMEEEMASSSGITLVRWT